MGYDILSNVSEKNWCCPQHVWGYVLDLAELFDWVPEHKDAYYYFGNDMQVVSAKDALGMARAMDRAIIYIRDVTHVNMVADGKILMKFDKTDIEHLRAFVDLASMGGFTIA